VGVNALDVIQDEVSGQKQPENLRNGVAQVVAAMTRVIESHGLWSEVWRDLHDVQGIRRDYQTRDEGIEAAGKAYNRVKTLLNRAALAHAAPMRR
jgi:hypothetical protein